MVRTVGSAVLCALAGCGGGASAPVDAARDLGTTDAVPGRDTVNTVLAVDFTVAGCPSLDPSIPRCTGSAPLTVELVAIGTGALTKYLWDFGDGTAKSLEASPVHTYSIPGTYTVSLVAGGGATGSASRMKSNFIVAAPGKTGESCEVDVQCDTGLQCVCGSAAKCATAFVRGLCASPCESATCRNQEVCADLSLSARGVAMPQAWQKLLCLRTCTSDSACGANLKCRVVPGRIAGTWVKGCFPDHPNDLGWPCRNASGVLKDDQCVSGLCANLGASGACSFDCSQAPCPEGSTCAEFTDGRKLCVKQCQSGFACDADPLLACVAPNAGPLGFVAKSAAMGATYCAPKTCKTSDACGAQGTCRMDTSGGHCARKD